MSQVHILYDDHYCGVADWLMAAKSNSHCTVELYFIYADIMFYGTRISNVRACVRATNSGVTPLRLNDRFFM